MSDDDNKDKKMPANPKGENDKQEKTHEDEVQDPPPVPPNTNTSPTKPSPPPSPYLRPGETPYCKTPAAASYSSGFVSVCTLFIFKISISKLNNISFVNHSTHFFHSYRQQANVQTQQHRTQFHSIGTPRECRFLLRWFPKRQIEPQDTPPSLHLPSVS